FTISRACISGGRGRGLRRDTGVARSRGRTRDERNVLVCVFALRLLIFVLIFIFVFGLFVFFCARIRWSRGSGRIRLRKHAPIYGDLAIGDFRRIDRYNKWHVLLISLSLE